MADASAIEWTDSTWNPVAGCSIVSPGCTNCYAMKMAARIEKMGGAPHYAGLTQPSKAGPVWTGKVARAPDHILTQPPRWKTPRRIFVNSMADLFHEDVPDAWIDQVFAVMALCPQHTFQVLTKRAARMRDYVCRNLKNGCGMDRVLGGEMLGHYNAALRAGVAIPALALPLPNVWLGVSVEDQTRADERIPDLEATPAAVRFLSCEPLLGPVDLTRVRERRGLARNVLTCDLWSTLTNEVIAGPPSGHGPINWVIAGGESGPGARPLSMRWVRDLRDQCATAATPFFFKQWGEWAPAHPRPAETPGRFAFGDYEHDRSRMIQTEFYPRQFTMFGARSVMERIGKKAAGATLDGREHREFPTHDRI